MAFPGDPLSNHPTDPYLGNPAYDHERDAARGSPVAPARGPHAPETTVTAGPFRFGLREGILGILAIFAVLGLVLGMLGFAAAFALDRAAEAANDGGNANDAALLGAGAIPVLLVSLLPFLAAPVLALGCGAWAGHASRDGRIGAMAGAAGGFLGPILMLLIVGIGFALGAGAASLNLDNVALPGGYGLAPGWANTIPYLFTGAGLLWLVANTLAAGLTGGIVGSLLDGRWSPRADRRRTATRRVSRY